MSERRGLFIYLVAAIFFTAMFLVYIGSKPNFALVIGANAGVEWIAVLIYARRLRVNARRCNE